MAKKEFTYRGLGIEKLQGMTHQEFAQLLPSRERRSILRGFTREEQSLLQKLEKRDKVKTHAREMIILPEMVGKTVLIHKGNGYEQVTITEEMIGFRLGQFALSRKIARHASPGVTGKKARVSVR